MNKKTLLVATITAALLGCQSTTSSVKEQSLDNNNVELQILAINDLHGNIATTSKSYGGSGRADYLAANLQKAKTGVPHSILVSSGDLIGGSPLVSAIFHDEPTIEVLNAMGLELSAVGNHELDEGLEELKRIQSGGSHPVDGDKDGDDYNGADFQFLAANIIESKNGATVFPPYKIKSYDGVSVAFIGITLKGAPRVISSEGVAGLNFQDEIQSVNALIPELQKQGIESFVLLLHEGGYSDGGMNDCGSGLKGPLATIANGVDDAVDLIISGHSHDAFICEIDGKTVTMAKSYGRLFSDIRVKLNKTTKDMQVVSATNFANSQQGVTPSKEIKQIIEKYTTISDTFGKQVVGHIESDVTRDLNNAGESAIGDVITDAQLAATSSAETGNAQIALTANGGIRASLNYATQGAEENGEVTFEEAFAVQPFSNNLVTMTLTGQQIHDLLEMQFTQTGILQVSKGFSYEWSASALKGDKIDPASIKLNGVTLSPGASYRVTVNSFIANGGDKYRILTQGTNRLSSSMLDYEVFIDYLKNKPTVYGQQNRIKRVK